MALLEHSMLAFSHWRDQFSPRAARVSAIIVIALLALFSGSFIGQRGIDLDFKGTVIILAALGICGAVAVGRRLWEAAFYCWILTFAVGYRTIHLNSVVSIHPSEVLIWLLFASVLSHKMTLHQTGYSVLPRIAWLFAAFWLIGIVRAFQVHVPVNWIIQGLLPVLAVIPTFMLVKEQVDSPSRWRTVGALLTVVTFYISFLGVLEYFVPSAVAPFHDFFPKPVAGTTVEGFDRAGFSFWGSPVVTQILVLFLPLLLAQWNWWRTSAKRVFLVATIAFTLIAIYIAGYRTVWFVTIFEILLYFWLRGNGRALIGTVLGLVVLGATLPPVARERVLRVLIEGYASDSSAVNRLQRIDAAWQSFQSQPLFGYGWGSTQFVHNDILQMAVTLGGIAIVLFILWYGYTVLKVWRVYRSPVEPWVREVAVALLTFLPGFLIMLFTQALINVAQLIIPLWFIFALSDRLPDFQQSQSPREAHDVEIVRTVAHVQ